MDGAPGRGGASTECLPRKLGVAAGLIGSRPSQYRQAQHKIYSSRWNSSGVFIAVLHLPWPHTLLRHAQAQPTQSQESSICGRLPRQDTSQVSVLSAIRRPTTPDEHLIGNNLLDCIRHGGSLRQKQEPTRATRTLPSA